jgi:transposase
MAKSGKASSAAAGGDTKPRPVGRPSKYQPSYADEVIAYCDQGYSLTAFAGEIGVDRASITRWADEHVEFGIAVDRAKAKRAAWWEKQACKVAENGGPGGQATMVIFGLKNHAPEDFKDKTEQEITVKGELADRLDELRKRRSTQG